VVDTRLRQHSVVLDLRLAQRRRVGRDYDKLGLTATHVLQGTLQTKRNLTRLHHELKLRVDVVLTGLLRLCLRSHDLHEVRYFKTIRINAAHGQVTMTSEC